ncbi:SDR family NAD(P)-dependent oxidoreductase [Rufibacter latericius]|uniref:SDR family oxidoreductase n=1 Tax=Rufibacter latericius TaxID=2487040 RepID=A0A3M9MIN0_9BACT|nr:SDR family oxidoreductase [Rufibacter latericius]RNI24518.1 SDR family oxidoreductase [Rufibacter latericius]
MQNYYTSKIVLITGGAQGIGRGLAQAFALEKAQVIITDLDWDAGADALGWLRKQNLMVEFMPCDVSKEEQVQQLMNKIRQQHGRLDVLINNAAIASPARKPLGQMRVEEFDQVLAVNLRGPFLCAKYAVPLLEKATNPAILNITSTRAFMSEPNTFGYTASKGGLEALTHSLAVSLTQPMIRVNAISPGWIETGSWQREGMKTEPHHSPQDKDQHPVGRVGTPEDIAEAALFLCSDKAGFISGQSLTIDGGMTVKMIYHE